MSFLNFADIYESPTIEQLADKIASHKSNHPNTLKAPSSAEPDVVPPRQSTWNAISVTIAQSTWLLLELLVGSALGYLGLFWFFPFLLDMPSNLPWLSNLPSNLPWLSNLPSNLAWLSGGIGFTVLFITIVLFLLTVVSLVFLPLSVAIAIGAKRILIGKYTPTRVPVWSGFYFRMWMVRQFMRFIPWGTIAGTEFQCIALRALGARIGKRVHIHRGVNLLQGGWDLLNIGDDVTLSQDSTVGVVELEKGQVVLGPVTLEDGATLDVRAGVGPNTRVGQTRGLLRSRGCRRGVLSPPVRCGTGYLLIQSERLRSLLRSPTLESPFRR